MSEDIDRDPAEEWLREQLRQGRGYSAIAKDLDVHRSTVRRNVRDMRGPKGLAMPFRQRAERRSEFERGERARLAREAKVRRQAQQRAEAARKLKETEQRARRRREDREATRLGREKRELAARRERTRDQIAKVAARLRRKGTIQDDTLHGDADYLLGIGADVVHYDAGAEIVAFAPDNLKFPCGWTAKQLRRGVTPEQRMRPTAFPPGSPRPYVIGERASSVVSFVVWPDEKWLYGSGYPLVERWRKLMARPLLDESNMPRLPTKEQVTWYEELLQVEVQLLEKRYMVPEATDRMKIEPLSATDDGMWIRLFGFEDWVRHKEEMAPKFRRMASIREHALGLLYLAMPVLDKTPGEAAKRGIAVMVVLGLVAGTVWGLLMGLWIASIYAGQSVWAAVRAIMTLVS